MKEKLTNCTVNPVDRAFSAYLKIEKIVEDVAGPKEKWSNEVFNHLDGLRNELCVMLRKENNISEISK